MDLEFSKKLIKGKITEAIFEEMFRTTNEYIVLPLGYEHTTPILAQYRNQFHVRKVLDNLSNAPDFALITDDKKSVYFVEVRYKNKFDKDDILKDAKELYDADWNPCFLFVASREKFFYGSVQDIINKEGQIDELSDIRVRKELQQQYLSLLHEFIK
jgi:hypothetical protein